MSGIGIVPAAMHATVRSRLAERAQAAARPAAGRRGARGRAGAVPPLERIARGRHQPCGSGILPGVHPGLRVEGCRRGNRSQATQPGRDNLHGRDI